MRRSTTSFFPNLPLLEGLPTGVLEALDDVGEVLELRKRQSVWRPGDMADQVFFVGQGLVKVARITEEGRELTLQFHTKGELFGEVAAFAEGRHDSRAEAYEETRVHALPCDVLVQLMREHPELALRVTRLVLDRRERLEHRVGALLFKTAHARLAALFLELSDTFGVRDSRGVILNLKLTHREMAALIGATRETVSFAILDMRRDGLIETEAKRVILLDEEGLRALAT